MSLKKIAEQANILEESLNIDLDASMHKFTQEVWEFNDAIQKYRGIYCKTKYETLDEVYGEASDVIFNFISILNKLGINADVFEQMAQWTLNNFIARKDLYLPHN